MVKVITSKDEYTAIEYAIKSLEDYSKLENIFVVVPDRASLLTEIEIINTLKEEGYLNIEVITLDTLCRRVNEEIGDISSKASSYVLMGVIKSLLNKNNEKLECFRKASSNVGFAGSLYSTILQIKASGIKPKELLNDIDKLGTGLKQKLKDISLIYDEYEKFLVDVKDDLSKFSLAIEGIKTSEIVKNSHFMFLHNSSFTFWGEEILRGLVKYAKSVVVSCENKPNGLNEVFEIAERVCYEEGIKAEITNYNKEFLSNVKLYKARTIRDEVLSAALMIKRLQKEGETDITLAVSGLKNYEWEIKNVFSQLDIPCYLDVSLPLISFAAVKFVLGILNILAYDFNQEDVLNLSKNFFFGVNHDECSDFENQVLKSGRTGAMFFNDEKLQPIREEYENFKNAKNLNEYAAVLLRILDKFDLINKAAELDAKAEGTLLSTKKAMEILEEFGTLKGNLEVSYLEFIKILEASFTSMEISLAALTSGTIFVGDVSESYFGKSKHLFILGAADGMFPVSKQDDGLLLDRDIEELSAKNKIQPTIKLVNRRAEERCEKLLTLGENIYLSYFKGEETNSPSLIYSHLAKRIEEEEIDLSGLSEFNMLKTQVITKEFLKKVFYENYSKFLKYEEVDEGFLASLVKMFEGDELLKYINEAYEIKNTKELFFKENRASITEIENYFSCPLRHLFNNGLKLKEQETAKLQSFDVGNIYHDFLKDLEIYLLTNERLDDEKVFKQAERIKDKIFKDEKYCEQLELKENALLRKVIEEEIPKIAKNLYFHHKNSAFKPKQDEKGVFTLEYKTKYKVNNIDLIGKIDRVDYIDDAFRVIDYKTSSNGKEFSYSDFVYGLSLQLLVYGVILKETTEKNKTFAGGFYYPVKIKGDSEFNAKLNGLILTDLELIRKMDLTYKGEGYSQMLPVRITKEGKASSTKMLSAKQLDNVIKYAKNMVESSLEDILKGVVKPSVLTGEKTCEYCPFFKIGKCTNILVRKRDKYDKTSFGGENGI